MDNELDKLICALSFEKLHCYFSSVPTPISVLFLLRLYSILYVFNAPTLGHFPLKHFILLLTLKCHIPKSSQYFHISY